MDSAERALMMRVAAFGAYAILGFTYVATPRTISSGISDMGSNPQAVRRWLIRCHPCQRLLHGERPNGWLSHFCDTSCMCKLYP
jgi:hypothetical protein